MTTHHKNYIISPRYNRGFISSIVRRSPQQYRKRIRIPFTSLISSPKLKRLNDDDGGEQQQEKKSLLREQLEELTGIPANKLLWIETKTADGKPYFYQAGTRATTWKRPSPTPTSIVTTQEELQKRVEERKGRQMRVEVSETADVITTTRRTTTGTGILKLPASSILSHLNPPGPRVSFPANPNDLVKMHIYEIEEEEGTQGVAPIPDVTAAAVKWRLIPLDLEDAVLAMDFEPGQNSRAKWIELKRLRKLRQTDLGGTAMESNNKNMLELEVTREKKNADGLKSPPTIHRRPTLHQIFNSPQHKRRRLEMNKPRGPPWLMTPIDIDNNIDSSKSNGNGTPDEEVMPPMATGDCENKLEEK